MLEICHLDVELTLGSWAGSGEGMTGLRHVGKLRRGPPAGQPGSVDRSTRELHSLLPSQTTLDRSTKNV